MNRKRLLTILKKNEGSFTIEACITFIYTLVAVLFLIYMASYLMDKAYLQSVVNRAVKKTALVCNEPNADFKTGRISEDDIRSYNFWHLYAGDLMVSSAEEAGNAFLRKHADGAHVEVAEVNVQNLGFTKKVSAEIIKNKGLPFSLFGLEKIKIEVKATTYVNNTKNYIDNIDFIIDVLSKFKGKKD